ncbi:type IV secretory system conjugative DNA transfer family protein [Streptomyces cacaoi]|uniref:type IV secretory system conjugative DNA transfer family protein n=1 Tax=Streptomyces cacaoi TaxID=1898 RepID=UPI003748A6F7
MGLREDFLLGTDEAGRPVYLPDGIRTQHVTILGATGTGKSTLLENMILTDIKAGTSCIVIDAHGDLTDGIVRKTPAKHKERVHLLEVWRNRPFGLNLLELPNRSQETIDIVAPEILLLFKRMFEGEAEFRPQLDHDLDLIIRTLLANEGTTLAETLDLLGDKTARERLTRNLTNRALLASWAEYSSLSARDQASRNAALRNRLNRFLGSETMSNIVGQAKTTVPLKRVMDTPGQALLLSLPVGGQGSELESKFLGNLFVSLIARLIFQRAGLSRERRNRVHLYLDEYGRYATPTTAKLFTDIRKYEVSLTVAHQSRGDVRGAGNEDAELQAGTLVCFHPATGEDADAFAGDVRVEPRPAEEPARNISFSPVKELRTGAHESDEVLTLSRRTLDPLHELILEGGFWREWHHDKGGPWMSHKVRVQDLDDALSLINDLLVDVMKGKVTVSSRYGDFLHRLAAIAQPIRPYLADEWWDSNESTYEHVWRHFSFRRALHLRDPLKSDGTFLSDLFSLCSLLAKDPIYVSIPGRNSRPAQLVHDAQDELANSIKGLPNHFAYVRLRTDPVQVSRVGLSPPGKNLHPPAPSLDEVNELLSQFASGRGRELVRFDDHPLPTIDAEFVAKINRQWREEVLEKKEAEATSALKVRSIREFGVTRDVVEAEIRDRRLRLFGPHRPLLANPGDQNPDPPIGRRSPKKK